VAKNFQTVSEGEFSEVQMQHSVYTAPQSHCEHRPEGLRRFSGVPHLVVLEGYALACIILASAAGPGSRAAPA
jgi:hypothetical protein